MQKETLQKIMTKYGFQSFTKGPFLYVGEKGVGISFTWKDPFYKTLTRLFIPKDEREAEEFLQKFYWYKKNGQTNQVRIILDDYEREAPKITFHKDDQELSLKDMQELLKNPKTFNHAYSLKLKRTALLLLDIIEKKINVQNTTYQNLVSLTNHYQEKKYALEKILQTNMSSPKPLKEELIDYTTQLKEIKKNIYQINNPQSLQKNIETLLDFLKNLEMSDDLIQNKYELIKIPLEIEMIEEQIKALENQPKEKYQTILEDIKSTSALSSIVNYETYRQNEQQRIEEKYTLIPDMDIRTVADFLADFDNILLKEPLLEEKKEKITYEQAMENLESTFMNRSKEEQKLLTLFHSPLKKYYANQRELMDLINHPNNLLMKIKYFHQIDTQDEKKFQETVVKELSKIQKIKPQKLLTTINVFFKSSNVVKSKLLSTSNKRLLAPSNTSDEITFIAKLQKDSEIYFIPEAIEEDENYTLVLKQNKPLILINLQKNKIKEEKSAILSVVNYKEVFKEENNYRIVTSLTKTNTEQYKQVIIERRSE